MSDADALYEFNERVAIMAESRVPDPEREACLLLGLTRIAVCGGRDYLDREKLFASMDKVLEKHPKMVLVHGGCETGADEYARQWAGKRFVPQHIYLAQWDRHGKGAGPIRNRQMARSGLTGLVAFPGGRGTDNMVRHCRDYGVPVLEVT